MFRKSALLTLVLATALLPSACGANISLNLFTADEVVSQTFTTSAAPHIVVETFNGGIDVITGTDNTVRADVTKRGGGNSQDEAQQDLKNVAVTMTQDGDTIHITAQRTDHRVDIGNSGASASLKVPNGATLDLRTSNGGITSAGPVGDVTADTSNGKIDIRGSAGSLDLSTSNGGITVNGGAGTLQAETSNGGIDLTSDHVVVTARTSNGNIQFTSSLAGDSEFRTSNSGMTITLPASASFTLNADTSNGKINSDSPVTTSGNLSDTELRGTVGSNPAFTLGLHTSNGTINLRQSQ